MIDLALSPEEEKKRTQVMQMQQAPLAEPQAPRQEKGMAGQMMDMAKQRAMSGALNAGQEGITEGITSALAPSAGAAKAAKLASTPATMGMGGAEVALTGQALAPAAGSMAAIGTAVPYIGAGLLAGKALGLFNQGGQIGPLSAQYHAEGTMTEEQARALMMNQPEPIQTMPPTQPMSMAYQTMPATKTMPMVGPIMRPDPDELYNEIVAESMTEAAQQQIPQPKMRPPLMVDPYGADTTYDAEMYKQINT